ENFSLSNPETYSQLFKVFFQSTTLHHKFLTLLVGKARGINLSHLGLAGLLRDHPEWGHTVFTTNFDDLLLRALFSLNHTARIFGDVESQEEPSLSPNYPQIVHLHGRHTGYRLVNTDEQMSLINPTMETSFKKHIAETHLLVLGYSGWDDLVMKTLEEWPQKHSLLRGNLFWIPYRSSSSILPETMDFLNACPVGRVQIIENDDQSLEADSFILQLCSALNSQAGGFAPYRKGILDHASTQHAFALKQLREHPDFDPQRVITLINEAWQSFEEGNDRDGRKKINEILTIANASDIPEDLRAKAFLEIGTIEMRLQNYDVAGEHLDASLRLWDRIKESDTDAVRGKARTLRTIAELGYLCSDLDRAWNNLKRAAYRYNRLDMHEEVGLTHKMFGDILLRQGKIHAAISNLEKSIEIFKECDSSYGLAIASRVMGDANKATGDIGSASKLYTDATRHFTTCDDEYGLATTRQNLAEIAILEQNYPLAEQLLSEAQAVFERLDYRLGITNVEHILGDLHAKQGHHEDALALYKKCMESYSTLQAKQGLANATADYLRCVALSETTALDEEEKQALSKHLDVENNAYITEARKMMAAELQESTDPDVGNQAQES
ncbi:MAG: tetratricopeptide repeat protein, partial [Acidobacteriota bacterium]